MNVGIASDLHLEFYRGEGIHKFTQACSKFQELNQKLDLFVLAGDILCGPDRDELRSLYDACHLISDNIIYVFGNHEYYGSSREAFTFLEDSDEFAWVVPGDKIVTKTLTTDREYKLLISTAWFKRTKWCFVNDPQAIRDFGSNWTYDSNSQFRKRFTESSEKFDIVITHHLPLESCVAEKYKGLPSNNNYIIGISDKEFDNVEHPPDYWFFGHTHSSVDFQYNNTTFLANPYGYYKHERYESIETVDDWIKTVQI